MNLSKIFHMLFHSTFKIQHSKLLFGTGDVKHSLADINKAKDRLGFTVSKGFKEGLRDLIEEK